MDRTNRVFRRRRHTARVDLSSSLVAITGAAQGIGRATAEEFFRHGAQVLIGDIDDALATRTAKEIDPTGSDVTAMRLDVTRADSLREFIDAAEAMGGFDVLVNNAGIMPTGMFRNESPTMTERMLAINLDAVIRGSRQSVDLFLQRGAGHVVNVASLAGTFAIPALATYGATKSAVISFTDALSLELAGTGVEATAILPGMINTELSAGANYKRWLAPAIVAEPEDVAVAIVRVVTTAHGGLVSVPRQAGATIKVLQNIPRRPRIAIERFAGLDTAFAHADHSARERYHRRISDHG
ncbi:SDR family NAD(P)-dependent oxidoreductase [Williamsia sterculiae]|uniref:Short-chain dehydrogenase n=1 Tax=Williamsia sterculiae TaxID=1344003 RepID=A0A1N7HCP6_9NOCA|nr:SDR family NAD(P)-dependent oxidoreductase [Williamsia sterculiae]SIS22543.1 Short-chain dehydrogenase [Williamsia sterculiae]